MTSPTTLPSQPLSRPGRRPKHAGEGEELARKPKKVNSEVRKQQNRIASRNYREKRKRKLQYLQQLIKDGSNDPQELEPSPKNHDVYARSISADYEASGPSSSPYILPSNSDFEFMTSSSAAVSDPPILAASVASFADHTLPTTQSYSTFGPNWNTPIYSPPPPANMTWNIPAWMPNIEYSSRVIPRAEVYHYTPSQAPPVLDQIHTPSDPPQELLSSSDLYGFGSSYESQSQTSGIPNVSLPTSSSYYRGFYLRPH